jgi:hypothetical protein
MTTSLTRIRPPFRHALSRVWLLAAIVLTPLCGAAFGCGCDWPWLDFFHVCNAILKTAVLPHCPWCVHPLWAMVSIGSAVGVASLLIVKRHTEPGPRPVLAQIRDCGLGLAAFVATALMTGLITALTTSHPRFLGLAIAWITR